MSEFKPSKYQQALYDEMLKNEHNIIVSAVAGAGKTTSIVNALDLLPSTDSKILLAFNKAIVEDLKTKITASNTTIQTLHSAGFSIMMHIYKSRLDNYKYANFLKK